MKALNKEDYWDEIERLYPEAFKAFGEWIDKKKTDESARKKKESR